VVSSGPALRPPNRNTPDDLARAILEAPQWNYFRRRRKHFRPFVRPSHHKEFSERRKRGRLQRNTLEPSLTLPRHTGTRARAICHLPTEDNEGATRDVPDLRGLVCGQRNVYPRNWPAEVCPAGRTSGNDPSPQCALFVSPPRRHSPGRRNPRSDRSFSSFREVLALKNIARQAGPF